MLQNIKRSNPLRLAAIVLLSTVLFAACNDDGAEVETTEVKSTEMKVDSLPPIDRTDTLTTTAPETIKN